MKDIVLSNALIFDHAYTILNKRFQQGAKEKKEMDMALLVPVAMNCAFSCELFLKSLLPPKTRGHKLYDELFKKVDSEIADKIKLCVVDIMKDVHDENYSVSDFYKDLIKNQNAFDNWRYFHENEEERPKKKKEEQITFDLKFMGIFQSCLKAIAIAEVKK